MRYLIPITALFLVALPSSVAANCSGNQCNDVQVTMIHTVGNITYLKTSGDEDLLDCNSNGDWLRVRRDDVEYEDWYALVLTAFAQEAPIYIRTESGGGLCMVELIYQMR